MIYSFKILFCISFFLSDIKTFSIFFLFSVSILFLNEQVFFAHRKNVQMKYYINGLQSCWAENIFEDYSWTIKHKAVNRIIFSNIHLSVEKIFKIWLRYPIYLMCGWGSGLSGPCRYSNNKEQPHRLNAVAMVSASLDRLIHSTSANFEGWRKFFILLLYHGYTHIYVILLNNASYLWLSDEEENVIH